MANTYVRGITKETSNKIITVKILRLWISTDQQKKPVSIEAILMDSEGSKIPAYVKRGLVSNFKRQLIEGETVSLANFGVEDNNQSKWTKARVQCPVKLIFNYITKVIKCKPDMWIQSNGLELVPFDDIPSFIGEYFIDIIGRIIRIGSIIYVDKAHARKLDIEIEENTSLKVVLWESYADKLLEIAPTNEKLENSLTMALQFAHKSIWQEELRNIVTSRKGLKALALDEEGNPTDMITNIVYKEFGRKLRKINHAPVSNRIWYRSYLMDTGHCKHLQSRNRSPLYNEGPISTRKRIRIFNNLSGEISFSDITNVLSPIHCDRAETNTPNVCSSLQAYTQSNRLTPSSSSFSCITDVHGYALLTPPNSHDIPESLTSVRPDKHLTVRPRIRNQLRRDIYGETNTSNKALYSRNMDEDYKIVSRFNKINRRFTLSMRRHLKSHPFDYFMYREDPRGYRIKVPPFVEECMPLAEKRIEQLLDKYTLNEIRVMSEEPSHVDMHKETRKRAMKKIHEKKDIIARRNSGILAIVVNRHIKSRNYIDNIRAYNMMYAFTLMDGIQDKTVNNGHGPYTYRLGGNNYHLLGSLLPKEGDSPKFSQLYMYCGEDETQERIDVVRSKSPATIDPSIVDGLKSMIDAENPIAQNFRMAAERFKESSDVNVKLCLMGRRSRDGRMYNLPTCSEVAALIVGNDEYEMDPRDIVLERKNGDFQRISELHPSYLPMQYPLLFQYGEDGYHPEISHSDKSKGARHKLTIKEFLAFRIFDRIEEAQTILLSRKLFQQFIVDGYMMMEAQRLAFIMRNQPLLRSDKYKSLDDAIRAGDIDPAEPIGNIGNVTPPVHTREYYMPWVPHREPPG
ncbi:hypothetical protein OROMI_020559 [Orobanche minor]